MYKECRHIMPTGVRCQSPVLRGGHYCYFHARLHRMIHARPAPNNAPLPIPMLEDTTSVQIALTQVLGALNSSSLDPSRARLMLYGLQIAAQVTRRPTSCEPSEAVQSVSFDDQGEMIAPENIVCKSSDDCSTCEERDNCEDFDPEDED